MSHKVKFMFSNSTYKATVLYKVYLTQPNIHSFLFLKVNAKRRLTMEKEELEWKMRSFTTADCPNSSANSGPMSMSMMEGKLFLPNSQWYKGVSKVSY